MSSFQCMYVIAMVTENWQKYVVHVALECILTEQIGDCYMQAWYDINYVLIRLFTSAIEFNNTRQMRLC